MSSEILAALPIKKVPKVFVWCIMPSHIHVVISSQNKPLEDLVRDMKSHT